MLDKLLNKDSREYKDARIKELKRKLAETDYKAIKFAEGLISEEEYAPVREYRMELRKEINELE